MLGQLSTVATSVLGKVSTAASSLGQIPAEVSKLAARICPPRDDEEMEPLADLNGDVPDLEELSESGHWCEHNCCESTKCSMSLASGLVAAGMTELVGGVIFAVTVFRPYYSPTPNNAVGDLICQSVGGVTGGVLMLIGIGTGVGLIRKECC